MPHQRILSAAQPHFHLQHCRWRCPNNLCPLHRYASARCMASCMHAAAGPAAGPAAAADPWLSQLLPAPTLPPAGAQLGGVLRALHRWPAAGGQALRRALLEGYQGGAQPGAGAAGARLLRACSVPAACLLRTCSVPAACLTCTCSVPAACLTCSCPTAALWLCHAVWL
jgi:hypothetical protein